MGTAIAGQHPARVVGQAARLLAVVIALAAAMLGYGLADALTRAKTSDAFLLPPTFGQIAGYALTFAVLAGLALAFELGAPPLAAKGGHAARNFRALIRRRFRHGRTRAEIANVETGLTISFCAVLLALILVFVTGKALLVVIAVATILFNLEALSSIVRLVGHDPKWSSLIGFVYGLVAGYILT